jgi:hypothetical protein
MKKNFPSKNIHHDWQNHVSNGFKRHEKIHLGYICTCIDRMFRQPPDGVLRNVPLAEDTSPFLFTFIIIIFGRYFYLPFQGVSMLGYLVLGNATSW